MDNIIEPSMDYDFSKIYLGPPATLSGGSYFTRLMHGNKPLFIQTPKSLTKQGFIKSGKKIYTDLMFDNNDTVFINWIENLETKCQDLIFNKGQSWFESKLERDDIETAFTSPFKIFKSGKFYLLRVNVKPNIKIYDETVQTISIDDVSADKTIISILEIQGIKFTAKNFQIEFELKQSMVVSPDPFLDECFIKKPLKKSEMNTIKNTDTNNLHLEKEKEKEKDDLNDYEENENSKKKIEDIIEDITEDLPKDLAETNNEEIEIDLDGFINKAVNDLSNTNNLNVKFEGIDLDLEEPYLNLAKNTNDDNILLDIEELPTETNIVDDINILKEVDFTNDLQNNLETITLKKPNHVYYEIYQKAREKAKEAKKSALLAYLEMKNIKKTYLIDNIDGSDSDSEFDDLSSKNSDSNSESDSDTESLENVN